MKTIAINTGFASGGVIPKHRDKLGPDSYRDCTSIQVQCRLIRRGGCAEIRPNAKPQSLHRVINKNQ
ncbi:MAG TPA: hypothetical protein VKZ42_00575 [Flavobacteriaceae bacterium]|nr:hypothetical protein [Flavobacteriaceae bacterium]